MKCDLSVIRSSSVSELT